MLKSTSTNAPFGKCSHTETGWDSKHSKFSAKEMSDCCGEGCKKISLCNGDLVIEASGACGYEITDSSFHDKGWE